jgi:hypothetical protein
LGDELVGQGELVELDAAGGGEVAAVSTLDEAQVVDARGRWRGDGVGATVSGSVRAWG